MITNSSIRSIHDTLKNAIGYNNGFNVEIGKDSISNLDICIKKYDKKSQKGTFQNWHF